MNKTTNVWQYRVGINAIIVNFGCMRKKSVRIISTTYIVSIRLTPDSHCTGRAQIKTPPWYDN